MNAVPKEADVSTWNALDWVDLYEKTVGYEPVSRTKLLDKAATVATSFEDWLLVYFNLPEGNPLYQECMFQLRMLPVTSERLHELYGDFT